MIIANSLDVANYFRRKIKASDVEEFWTMGLSSSCQVLKARMLFRGTVDSCFVHPRDIFRFAVKWNASSIIVAHNHPSGDPKPSSLDIKLSGNLLSAGQILKIPILDHVIVTKWSHFSFADSLWKNIN